MTKREALGPLRELAATTGFRFPRTVASILETPHLDRAISGFIERVLAEGYSAAGAATLSHQNAIAVSWREPADCTFSRFREAGGRG